MGKSIEIEVTGIIEIKILNETYENTYGGKEKNITDNIMVQKNRNHDAISDFYLGTLGYKSNLNLSSLPLHLPPVLLV